MIRFPSTNPPKAGIGMAPLVDVVFLLLIFFMLTTSFVQPSLKLSLPAASNKAQGPRPQVIVTVDHKGELWVNYDRVDLETLEAKLTGQMTELGVRDVVLRADRKTPLERFVTIMDRARRAGADNVFIAHAPER
jgi:biopolymer transport protein ExbD